MGLQPHGSAPAAWLFPSEPISYSRWLQTGPRGLLCPHQHQTSSVQHAAAALGCCDAAAPSRHHFTAAVGADEARAAAAASQASPDAPVPTEPARGPGCSLRCTSPAVPSASPVSRATAGTGYAPGLYDVWNTDAIAAKPAAAGWQCGPVSQL